MHNEHHINNYNNINKECARFSRTLLGGLLHAGSYNLENDSRYWTPVYLNFPPLRMRTLARLSGLLILHPASHQSAKSENSLVLLQLW